ncbi:B3 domain-containing transcription factor VRN1-like [Gastrolobium bilobum]|uniref:B3 domain-containing transcription factor VRN1-like n=1 Tax=Gastrolobium bilobum TaxID=150636 RepID=UPI002AB0D2AE|nr:B3 domain-containing transcription factor VRN1-like [Gastrolobium bilobum]
MTLNGKYLGGWKEFATYYSLDHGHMVLFEYKHTSHFDVRICDKSTLEIDYPFHGTQDAQGNLDQISDDDSVKISDELPPFHKTRQKSPISSPQPCKKLRTCTSEAVEDDIGDTTEFLRVKQFTSKTTEAINKAQTFRSRSPSFTIVMKPSYVDGHFLHVPLQFAEIYLKKEERNILLQVLDGRTWTCKYRFPNIFGRWKEFVSDNDLKVGDVCLFEITKIRDLSLKVQIFPLAEESNSPPVQETVQGDGIHWFDPGRVLHVGCLNINSRKDKKTTKRSSLLTGALKEASEFASENPFFKVKIRADNKFRPNVPFVFMRDYYNNNMMQIVMLQFGKKLWPVKLVRTANRDRDRWKLSNGWSVFARESKLVGGDYCVFELINIENAVLNVHIFRGHG